jgi:hypothetical protein
VQDPASPCDRDKADPSPVAACKPLSGREIREVVRRNATGSDKATERTRTVDLRFTKPLLYQLSYGGSLVYLTSRRHGCPGEADPRLDGPSSEQQKRRASFLARWERRVPRTIVAQVGAALCPGLICSSPFGASSGVTVTTLFHHFRAASSALRYPAFSFRKDGAPGERRI